MKLFLACPARAGTRHGNRVTALRWARILRRLGCRVTVGRDYDGKRYDLLVALHARKSAAAVERFHALHPLHPIVVALTGTDLYRDLRRSARARNSLRLATRIVALQPLALRELPPRLRRKTRVIHQSAERPKERPPRRTNVFEVAVVAHLRPLKDPLRAAAAARRLPRGSRIRIVHLGRALTRGMADRARREAERNPRYVWLGERTAAETRRILARSRLLVLSSRLEGGANVISEALRASVPVLASRIPGSIGLLGTNYPGFFPVADTRALARLLTRAESDPRFYRRLERACALRTPLFEPAREVGAWRELLGEISAARGSRRQRDGASPESRTSPRRRRERASARRPLPR